MATTNTEMTREQREAMVNKKMELMRIKNEEINRRHKEIEEDKQNADQHSSSVLMEDVKPYVMKTPRPRPDRPEKPAEGSESLPSPRQQEALIGRQRLTDEDGPPPDPSYRFLADPDRDGTEEKFDEKREEKNRPDNRGKRGRGRGFRGSNDSPRQEGRNSAPNDGFNEWEGGTPRGRGRGNQRRGGRRGRGSYHSEFTDPDSSGKPGFDDRNFNNRGGRGRGRGGDNRGRGRQERRVQEYERWKAERMAIDEARINRAKNNEGEWRREWDLAKLEQGEPDDAPIYDARFPPRKEDSLKLGEFITTARNNKHEGPQMNEPRNINQQSDPRDNNTSELQDSRGFYQDNNKYFHHDSRVTDNPRMKHDSQDSRYKNSRNNYLDDRSNNSNYRNSHDVRNSTNYDGMNPSYENGGGNGGGGRNLYQDRPRQEAKSRLHDSRSNQDYTARGRGRGRVFRSQHRSQNYNVQDHEKEIMADLNPDVLGDRKVIGSGDNLQVTLPVADV